MSNPSIVKVGFNSSPQDSVTAYLFEDYTDEEVLHRTDYVIVVKRDIKNSKYFPFVQKYLQELHESGVKVELAFGTIPENAYLKLHVTKQSIQELAEVYEIDIQNTGHHYFSVSSINLKLCQTAVTLNQDIFRRKGEATNMERILIVYRLLNDARFGDSRFDNNYGIQKLQRLGAVVDAFPLHDGNYEYDEDSESLNDRQVLLKYWANFSMWYKEQPLNLIEKYYGTEVAFYFAWLGLYNSMLVLASAIGVLCFLISVILSIVSHDERIDEVCNSKLRMCPPCSRGHTCVLSPLRTECFYLKMSLLFDNHLTFFFAIFMSFWATAFLNMWKRTEKILKIRWNVENVLEKTYTRLVYKETSVFSRLSSVTGHLEPYTPVRIKAAYYCLTYGICVLLVGVVLLAIFGIIMYRISLVALLRVYDSEVLSTQSLVIESITTAVLQVIFIKIYGKFYGPISQWLTELENPRTQLEFDNSVIYKKYFLAFTNNYAALFYIAFLKGKFYSPGHTSVASVNADLCHSFGCSMVLCMQLFVIMLLKSLLGNILTLIIPIITRRFKKKPDSTSSTVPQWERELLLYPAGRYLLTTEFMEMIIQYGFVTFFVAVFPLAPLCALVNNVLQLRLDAYELVTRYRRPVPKRNPGIGPWNKIIQSITHLSIVTNAFVLAFTSDFVARNIYSYQHGSLEGYPQSKLSVFDMKDSLKFSDVTLVHAVNSTRCHYAASRYPPDHPHKYELRSEYWFKIGMKLLCVVLFEHVILMANGIFARVIPDASQKLRKGINREKNREYEKKLAIMEENARHEMLKDAKPKVVLPWNSRVL